MEKLDCKSLMIGDWVCNLKGDILQIQTISESYVILNNDGYYYNEIQPIPLTPEILEKNGFEYKEKELGLYGVTIAPHYLRDDIPFEVFCDGKPFTIWFKEPVNIKFVHQLQHAMLLCGIRKEIVI